MKLGQRGRNWLLGFHIFFNCAWIGTAMSMVLLMFIKGTPSNGDELYAVSAAIKLMDDFIIIPAALGSLVTGLLFCWLTNWGFTKFYWIILKWVTTIVLIVFGTFWLGPWTNGIAAMSDKMRLMALQDPVYLHFREMSLIFGTSQLVVLLVLIFITALKPWGRRKKA